jgi:type II secretory pathway component PulF
MDVTPATKEQLAIEKRKLAGASVSESLSRWHRSVNQMSGAFVLLMRKPELVSLGNFDEWLARVAELQRDMERVRKKIAPKRKNKGR